jgi:hypothetical protein
MSHGCVWVGYVSTLFFLLCSPGGRKAYYLREIRWRTTLYLLTIRDNLAVVPYGGTAGVCS